MEFVVKRHKSALTHGFRSVPLPAFPFPRKPLAPQPPANKTGDHYPSDKVVLALCDCYPSLDQEEYAQSAKAPTKRRSKPFVLVTKNGGEPKYKAHAQSKNQQGSPTGLRFPHFTLQIVMSDHPKMK
jgi:hypothetical protein